MNWEWDNDKDRINKQKHGLTFKTAKLVFDDPLAASRRDAYPGEERWQTVGLIGSVVVLVFIHMRSLPPTQAKKVAGSSAPARPQRMKEGSMKKASSKRSTGATAKELAALAALPEDQIDTHAIPEQSDWTGARRGVFFRPAKHQLTLRLDADVVAWFKANAAKGESYQTRINNALRTYVGEHDQTVNARAQRRSNDPTTAPNDH